MAYVDPEEVAAGEKTSAAKFNVLVNDIKAMYAAAEGLGCRLYAGNTNLTPGVLTNVPFSMTMNAEIYDYFDDKLKLYEIHSKLPKKLKKWNEFLILLNESGYKLVKK